MGMLRPCFDKKILACFFRTQVYEFTDIMFLAYSCKYFLSLGQNRSCQFWLSVSMISCSFLWGRYLRSCFVLWSSFSCEGCRSICGLLNLLHRFSLLLVLLCERVPWILEIPYYLGSRRCVFLFWLMVESFLVYTMFHG